MMMMKNKAKNSNKKQKKTKMNPKKSSDLVNHPMKKEMKKIAILTTLTASTIPNSPSPTSMSMLLVMTSITSAAVVKTATTSTWMAAVLILTYSSGMMIMFVYTASMSPNEKTKKKVQKSTPILILPLLMTQKSQSNPKTMENMYTNKSAVTMGTLMLVVMMLLTKMSSKTKMPMSQQS